MSIKTKIKIQDNKELRDVLESEYELSSQIRMCKYSLLLATHILTLVDYPDMENHIIIEGFFVNDEWQKGNVQMNDVRNSGFKIHKLAKECDNTAQKAALRVVGHAISTAHMKEHAIVASDYAIKVINLLEPNNLEAVKDERLWQINQLKDVYDEGFYS